MKMRSGKIATLGLILACTTLVGCGGRGMIRADALKGVQDPVLDRHDAYVRADSTLTPTEVDIFLQSSAQMRSIVDIAATPDPE